MDPRDKKTLVTISAFSWNGDFTNSVLNILYIFYGVSRGWSTSAIGVIASIYGIAYLIAPALLGPVLDRLPSRKASLLIATGGQTLISLSYIAIILVTPKGIYGWILAGQIFRAVIYAFFWPTIEALYSETAGNDHRRHEKNISLFCISWSVGAAMGGMLGGVFGEWAVTGGFITVSCLYLVTFLVGLVFLPTDAHNTTRAPPPLPFGMPDPHVDLQKRPAVTTTSIFKRNGKSSPPSVHSPQIASVPKQLSGKTTLLFSLTGTLVFAIISKGVLSYFPNYAVLQEGLGFSRVLTGQLVFAFGVGQFIGFALGQWLSNSFTKMRNNILLLAPFLATLAITDALFLLVGCLAVIGYLVGRIYVIALDLVLKAHDEGKGAKAGLFESIVGLGTGLSPAIAGLIGGWSLVVPFLFYALLAVGAGIWLAASLSK